MFSCCLGRKVTGSAVSPLTRNCARRVPARVHLEVSPLPAHAFQKRPVRLVANPSYLGITSGLLVNGPKPVKVKGARGFQARCRSLGEWEQRERLLRFCIRGDQSFE